MIVTPGARIDRYEIVRAVASGGMGTVWLARISGAHGFAKNVAIKTIRPDLAGDAGARAMFVDEARIAMRIEHAHVAQVLDVGERDRVLYIVLEWIDGVSLEHLCGALGEPMPVAHVLRIAADACAGLAAAHELRDAAGAHLGLVHRDVSPHNILVSRAGVAKIIDFGIAKVRDRLAGNTDAGIVRGKRAYMAPEQVAGRALDRRADVWAMGATIYRALCGRPPFDEPGAYAAFVDGGAAPAFPPNLPPAVRDVVLRALAPAPGDRCQTAGDLERALEDAMTAAGARVTGADVAARFADRFAPPHDEPPAPLAATVPASPAARGQERRRSRRRLALALGALAVALLAVVGWRVMASDGERAESSTPTGSSSGSTTPSAPSETGAASPSPKLASSTTPGAPPPSTSSATNDAATPSPASTSSATNGAASPSPASSATNGAAQRKAATSSPTSPRGAESRATPGTAASRFAANDAVSYRDRGEWRDAIVEAVNRDGTIAIRMLNLTARSLRDVALDTLRPRKRLPPLPVGQSVRFGKLTCTIASQIATEQYMLACPFDQQLHATRSSLAVAD